MTTEELDQIIESLKDLKKFLGYERLEGMQGPEQGLVGEARSDSTTGHAKEAQPGERGVGEIALATELRRHIERISKEALAESLKADPTGKGLSPWAAFHSGRLAVLAEFSEILNRISKERSDLANH